MVQNLSNNALFRVGVDSGGTFTDVCAVNEETGELTVWKVNSTPSDPSDGILDAAQGIIVQLKNNNIADPQISYFGHGTTVGTNALIERRGVKTALITTSGFRDVLEIARQRRPELYNLQTKRPEPLVSRDLRFEVNERIQYDGKVLTPLNDDDVLKLVPVLKRQEVKSVAVALLFSFLNPEHEQRIKTLLQKELPDLFISISSDIVPEFREYERTSTVTVNSYLGPLMFNYINQLDGRLADIVPTQIMITQSNGGLISSEVAATQPVRTVLSGPSAGVTGSIEISRHINRPNLITFDMGGTSADVSIISNFMPRFKPIADVEGYPIKVPMIDIHAVGAGGGSIAFDDHGLIKVGPKSAGANPGPVCYGKGNLEPTVTDANVALGILNQSHLLNGRLPIDAKASQLSIEKLGNKLGLSWQNTAAGILKVVSANMVNAIRAMTVERGLDPRDFSLLSFGGAGPLHSSYLARELEISEIIIPAFPGVMCAAGLLTSGLRMDLVKTHYVQLTPMNYSNLSSVLLSLEKQAEDWFKIENIPSENRNFIGSLDIRYNGQAYELTIPIGPTRNPVAYNDLIDSFIAAHKERYGYDIPNESLMLTAVRIEAFETRKNTTKSNAKRIRSDSIVPIAYRDCLDIDDLSLSRSPVYWKESLPQEIELPGPCIIEQMDTTIVILKDQKAIIDRFDNVIISNI